MFAPFQFVFFYGINYVLGLFLLLPLLTMLAVTAVYFVCELVFRLMGWRYMP